MDEVSFTQKHIQVQLNQRIYLILEQGPKLSSWSNCSRIVSISSIFSLWTVTHRDTRGSLLLSFYWNTWRWQREGGGGLLGGPIFFFASLYNLPYSPDSFWSSTTTTSFDFFDLRVEDETTFFDPFELVEAFDEENPESALFDDCFVELLRVGMACYWFFVWSYEQVEKSWVKNKSKRDDWPVRMSIANCNVNPDFRFFSHRFVCTSARYIWNRKRNEIPKAKEASTGRTNGKNEHKEKSENVKTNNTRAVV